jgi:hypothetical protein
LCSGDCHIAAAGRKDLEIEQLFTGLIEQVIIANTLQDFAQMISVIPSLYTLQPGFETVFEENILPFLSQAVY